MKKIKEFILFNWNTNPYQTILFIALITRLLAAFFSKGYGMHDDHFLVIEPAQSWADGHDYNNWLPANQINPKPEGHSFFYVGLHYLFFCFTNWIGLMNPEVKMTIIRILHGLFSLITVALGYKITQKLSDEKSAKQVGLLLAVLWFMPFLSVRNLVEIFCIPFLMAGTWLLIKNENKKLAPIFWAGILFGLSFSVRFQTLFFIGGIGIVILLQKKWKETLVFGLAVLLSIVAIQGIVDYIIWGYPFAELTEYVMYNFQNQYNYLIGGWYKYILVLLGVLIPPFSIYLFYGFLRSWKKHLILFLPTFLFFVFHSYFANKQERFIFPIIPFFLILGVIGWNEWSNKSSVAQKYSNLINNGMKFFWILNILVLSFLSFTYSKKSRVESMLYLSKYSNIKQILVEDTNHENASMLPIFYAKQWVETYQLVKPGEADTLSSKNYRLKSAHVKQAISIDFLANLAIKDKPKFILFISDQNLEMRIKNLKTIWPEMKYETTISSSLIDQIMHKLNPRHNKSEVMIIYKNE